MKKKIIVYFALWAVLCAVLFTLFTSCRTTEGPGDGTSSDSTSEISPDESTKNTDVTTDLPTSNEQTTGNPSTTEGSETTKEPETTKAPETTKDPETTEPPVTTGPDLTPKSSGSFSGETNTSLEYRLDWTLVGINNGVAEFEFKVILSTYELRLSERKNLGQIVLDGGKTIHKFSTSRIDISPGGKAEIELYKTNLTHEMTGDTLSFEAEARWFFNGNYAGVDFEWLSAVGVITVTKN